MVPGTHESGVGFEAKVIVEPLSVPVR